MIRCVAVALVAALALAACGSDGQEQGAKPVGEVLAGSVAPMATCGDWNRGSRKRRIATIHDIRQQVNLRDSAVQTPALSDQQAYRIFRTTCAHDFATGFRLYKLYARSASFAEFDDG